MNLAAVVLLIVALGVAGYLVFEVRQSLAGRRFITRKRFALRLISGVLLLALLTAVALGISIFGLARPDARPLAFLIYWSSCMAAAFLLVVLVLLELKQIGLSKREKEVELWRDIARSIAENLPKKKD